MADERESASGDLIGPFETAFRLELTAAQLKVTHTALRALRDDFGHEEADVQAVVQEVLDKLPDDHEIRAIDLARARAPARRGHMSTVTTQVPARQGRIRRVGRRPWEAVQR